MLLWYTGLIKIGDVLTGLGRENLFVQFSNGKCAKDTLHPSTIDLVIKKLPAAKHI